MEVRYVVWIDSCGGGDAWQAVSSGFGRLVLPRPPGRAALEVAQILLAERPLSPVFAADVAAGGYLADGRRGNPQRRRDLVGGVEGHE
jgi:hypothetical protein